MKYLFFISFVIIIIGCNNTGEREVKEVDALRASKIYDVDSVYSYTQKYKDSYKEIANTYIEKGKKESEQNPDRAVYFFKRAITIDPTLNNYKVLAEQYARCKDYKELRNVYRFLTNKLYLKLDNGKDTAIYLYGPPDKELYYEFIVSNILAYQSLYFEDIFYAKEDLKFDVMEFKNRLIVDKRLNLDPKSDEFKNVMLQFLSPDELESYSKKPEVFSEFIFSIKDTSSNFNIDDKTIQLFNYNNYYEPDFVIDFTGIYIYYLKEKRDQKDEWFKFNFNHTFHINKNINAVVYAIDTSQLACPKEMRHIYHRLVTYDSSANIIDSKIVALQSGEQLETVRFDNKQFIITKYKRHWKNNYKKDDFDNYLTGKELIGETTCEIQDDGLIVDFSEDM